MNHDDGKKSSFVTVCVVVFIGCHRLSAESAADKAIEAINTLMDKIGVPKSVMVLAENCRVKIDLADIPELVAHAAADVCCSVNPVQYSPDDFRKIYEKAWS